MSAIITVWMWVLFVMTLLAIGAPLIDKVLNDNVIQMMDNTIDNLEYFIWSDNINTFLILICTTLIFIVYRFVHSYFKNW